MTIICALRSDKNVVIGADSLVCNGNYKLPGEAGKWIFDKKSRVAIGAAGWLRTPTLLQKHKNKLLVSCPLDDRLELLRRMFLDDDHVFEKKNGEPPTTDNSFLIVQDDRIYDVDGTFSPIECPSFAARGSGMDYAIGCLHGLTVFQAAQLRKKIKAAALVRLALVTACTFDRACGGNLMVEEI